MFFFRSYLKNLISFEALFPFSVLIIVVLLTLRLLASKTPGYKKRRKKFYGYLLAGLVVMGIFLTIMYNLKQTDVILRYFSFMSFAFVLGGLHVYFYRLFFNKFDSENVFKEMLFCIITAFALMVPIILISAYFFDLAYIWYYLLSMVVFIVPTAFFSLFNYSVSIPARLYTKWYYPLGKKYETPRHYELKNIIVLNFMFYKKPGDNYMTSFKARAPKHMDFGRLYFFFINDYNEKKTTTKIEITENSGDPHGWYFYTKPKWYGTSRHIDSELTVEENNLSDGDIVICQRI